jgi:hypothetical protein
MSVTQSRSDYPLAEFNLLPTPYSHEIVYGGVLIPD